MFVDYRKGIPALSDSLRCPDFKFRRTLADFFLFAPSRLRVRLWFANIRHDAKGKPEHPKARAPEVAVC